MFGPTTFFLNTSYASWRPECGPTWEGGGLPIVPPLSGTYLHITEYSLEMRSMQGIIFLENGYNTMGLAKKFSQDHGNYRNYSINTPIKIK